MARAIARLSSICSDTCGGAMQLEGCYVKYDNISFLGLEDKTVVFKKCGPSIGYNQGETDRRDSVLAAMGRPGSNPYRVSGDGDVKGLAQCVSDLSITECRNCLSAAIGRLKSDCGTAAYGDVFLGKCYARYSTNKLPQGLAPPDHENKSDDGAKAFAILIGLLAGVVLLVLFLAFIRKSLEEKGNKT